MCSGLFGRLEQELEAREKTPGLSMSDILTMPDNLRRLVSWMIRERQVELEAAEAYLGQSPEEIRALMDNLIEKGYAIEFEMRGKTFFRIRLALKRGREIPLDIWASLDDKCEEH